MSQIKFFLSMVLSVGIAAETAVIPAVEISAQTKDVGVQCNIQASGVYENWEGVSNVDQFVCDGQYCFAYYKKKTVYIVKTKNGAPLKEHIKLKMKHPIFGGVTCDSEGYFYLVTGKDNKTDDTSVKTVFISKYDKDGTFIQTVGDNGSSSLADDYDSSFYTKYPFDGGNCDIAVNGNLLAISYARQMYSGHQSNSVFMIDTDTMKKVNSKEMYQSHSFAQRAIPFGDHFLFASEGDCYERAFTIAHLDSEEEEYIETPVFDFWVKKDVLSNWDMFTLNDNFAHMGGLADVNGQTAALVGTSAKVLNKNAANQNEQLFIQIFDPSKDLSKADAYTTVGTRKGTAGNNGRTKVTNYGVKWLTNYNKKITIDNPQVVSDGTGTIAVLYEKYQKSSYKGVYYMILNSDGEIKKKETCFSKSAYLNPCRMPVYTNGSVYWTGNKDSGKKNEIYVYSFKL